MDSKTEKYYNEHAREASGLYNSAAKSGVSFYFQSAFAPGSTVLDIGAGSGRDMAVLMETGFDVYGIDPSPEMVSHAVAAYPQLKDRLVCASLPWNKLIFDMKFDSIRCSAVLMHISDDIIFDAVECIKNLLKENGRLLISVPVERADLDMESRTPDGRLFVMRSFDYYSFILEGLGFRRIAYYEEEDALGRSGVRWGAGVYEV